MNTGNNHVMLFFRQHRNVILSLILVILAFLTYGSILRNQLFFDDEELIYKNVFVQNLKYFPRYFTENMVAGAGKTSNMYRPILTLSMAIDYFFWHGQPFGFHLTSILLHAANAVLIYFLLLRLFKNQSIAFLTAFIFIIHPVHSEAVSYASGRTDPLFTLFSLLTLLIYSRFLDNQKKWYMYLFSVIFFTLALLSKESAIIVPVFLPFIVWLGKGKKGFTPAIILSLLPFAGICFNYIVLRLTILNFSNTLNFYTTQNVYSENIFVRLFTFTKVFFYYLAILFFPKDLVVARSPEILVSPLNIWTVSFCLLIILLSFLLIKYHMTKTIFFGSVWYLVALLPSSGIVPINNIITEHYLYFPSIGFFFIISLLLMSLWRKLHTPYLRISALSAFCLFSLILFGRTILRTFDWKDAITFYTVSLSQSPWHIPMRNNLALAYQDEGKFDMAMSQYQQIISTSDVYPNPHHNLANIYKAQGKYQLAEEEYYKALAIDPKFQFSLYALLDLYKMTGQTEKMKDIQLKLYTPSSY